MMKRITGILLAIMLLAVSAAYADTAVDVIMNTGTTQAFTDEAVSSEDLETILRAGLSTESAINQQPWFFVAVTNREIMNEIAGSGMGGFTPPACMEYKTVIFSKPLVSGELVPWSSRNIHLTEQIAKQKKYT